MTRLFAALLFASFAHAESRYEPSWASLDSRPLPTWYDEAKVGVFIVGGVFSVPSWGTDKGGSSGEWFWQELVGSNGKPGDPAYAQFMSERYPPGTTYPDFAASLTMDLFNASQWAELFKASGAQYTVFLTKHHDGYTLWPSATSPEWNSVDVGPRRDVTGEVSAAVKAVGLHSGLYHSLFEWYNPLYLADKANNFSTSAFVPKTMSELHDLVTRYEPDLIWSDGDWEAPDSTYWDAPANFLAWLVNDSPVKDTVVYNDRWGKGDHCTHGSFYTCSDRYNPGTKQNHKWENAMTLDRHSWGFRRNAAGSDYLSFFELMTQLISTVACGGNLLVNVGPALDGTIPPIMAERLLQMGAWLDVNGEGIYKTTPWRVQNQTDVGVWYTQAAAGVVYAHLLSWPTSGVLALTAPTQGAPTTNVTATLLTSGGGLHCAVVSSPSAPGLRITLPPYAPNLCGTGSDVAWAVRIEGVA